MLVHVVVVVPPFTHGDNRQNERVSTIVVCILVPLGTEKVGKRIDEERSVIEEHGGGEKSPDKHLETDTHSQPDEEYHCGIQHWWNDHPPATVHPAKAWIWIQEIAQSTWFVLVVLLREDPPDVLPV